MQISRFRMQLPVADFLWLFGLNPGHWSEITGRSEEAVKDPAVAILGRFLNEHPEAGIIPPTPQPAEIYDFFNLGTSITLKEFGLAFGRHMSAGHRWVSAGKETPAILHRMMIMLARHAEQTLKRELGDCLKNGVSDAERRVIAGIWRDWQAIVEKEAQSRGADNIWERTCWPDPRKAGAED